MKSIFVTGTDTDAGKTVAVAALLSYLRAKSVDAMSMKPIQTGCEKQNGQWIVPDIAFVLKAAGIEKTLKEQEFLCPFTFEHACSPHLAVSLEKKSICVDTILERYNVLSTQHKTIIVEGAGGILVPINKKDMMLDLMKEMKLPVVLVTRPGLGTINHTLLSINELRRAGLTVAGLIFCETVEPARNYIERDNRTIISEIGEVPILGDIPYINSMNTLLSQPKEFEAFSNKALSPAYDILKEL